MPPRRFPPLVLRLMALWPLLGIPPLTPLVPPVAAQQAMRRSEPTTEGERRLLEWDLNKSFDLSTARFSPRGTTSGKRFEAKAFQPGAFTAKSFSAASFYSPVYLPPESAQTPGAFKAKSFAPTGQTLPSKSFSRGNDSTPAPWQGTAFQPPESARSQPGARTFSQSERTFTGPEAVRKDLKFSMENAPRGGVFEGRQLTLEEVREILNKSK